MENKESMAIEHAFAREIGISVYTTMKILNDAGISPEDVSGIMSICKEALTNEIEKRNVPHEFRFLLISVILSRLLKTSAAFHREYMQSVKGILSDKYVLDSKDEKYPNIELVKDQ